MCSFWIEYEAGVVRFCVGEPFFVDAKNAGSCRSESVGKFILSYFVSWQNTRRYSKNSQQIVVRDLLAVTSRL